MVPRQNVPVRSLTDRSDLAQLKRQAKELLHGFTAGAPDAVAEVHAHYHGADASSFALHDALLVVARAYGFESWPKLKAYVDGATVHRLIGAVKAGDLDAARAMLAKRPELVHIDAAEHDEHRALHHAVLCGQPEMVRLLMNHGADARKGIYPHRDATSPLALATERGYAEIEAIIREAERHRSGSSLLGDPAVPAELVAALEGADREGADEDGVIAALAVHPELSRMADPHDGVTALHIAAARLWERLVLWLLDHGAAASAQTHRGHTPLDAIGRGSRRVSDADRPGLAARIEEKLIARGGERTVRSAIATGDVAWLSERHERESLQKQRGLLTHAVMVNRPEIVALLLDLEFDPDERGRIEGLEETVLSWGEPLRACSVAGRTAMAEMLLARGADPNTNVYASSSALYEAYARQDTATATLLERHGGTVNATIAGSLGLIERARELLSHGKTGEGDTARALLEAAAASGYVEIVRLALARIDWPRGDIRWRGLLMQPFGFHDQSEQFLACFQLMLDRSGAEVHRPGARTLLHDVAAAWPRRPLSADDRVAFASALLDAGARLDVREDLLKSTPLGWACRWGRTELVRLFLARGSDPVEADAEPWATPRAWAQKMNHLHLLKLLNPLNPPNR